MKTLHVLSALLTTVLAPIPGMAGEENPLKKATVGAWVEYEMGFAAGAGSGGGKLKVVLTAKNDRQATVKQFSIDKDGKERAGFESKIDLTRPLELLTFFAPEDPAKDPKHTKVEKVREGMETITVGGKKYMCRRTELRITEKSGDTMSITEMKTWQSKDVPLYGVVRTEAKSAGFATVFEVSGTGAAIVKKPAK